MRGNQPESVIQDDDLELQRRVSALIEGFPTRKEAAQIAGLSTDQLVRYLKGSAEFSLKPIARLCVSAGVSLDGLVTGKAPETLKTGASQTLRLDPVILGRAVYVLNGLLAHADSHLDPEDYAEMLLALVEYLREHSGALAPDNVISIMERIRSRRNERR